MSSIGKNVLTDYEGIVGECASLSGSLSDGRSRIRLLAPAHLHQRIKEGKEEESIAHACYARTYEAITGRAGPNYENPRGVYDQFTCAVVDFERSPPALRDDVVSEAAGETDLPISTFVDRVVETFDARMLFWDVLQ
ncbi:MAG: hypothetical protein BRD48_06260 [Bacteroidetes bacterium QS_9_68_14]|nr:MAG: hypothetical protein BRD48_06260 [Bacteroidetes bacterium QS_9_68_14]